MATTKKIHAKKSPVKKAATNKTAPAKAAPKADAPGWNTIHIFGYGETQIIGKEHNGKVVNTELKTIEPLLEALAEKQMKGTKVNLRDTHALNIFNGAFIDFIPKPSGSNKHQRFAWSDIATKHIDKLATELIGKVPEQKAGKSILDKFRMNREARVAALKQAQPKKAVKKVSSK